MPGSNKDSRSENAVRPESILAEVRVISGRRITLPEQVCEDYNVREGSKLTLVKQKIGWVITNASVASVTFRTPEGEEFAASLPTV